MQGLLRLQFNRPEISVGGIYVAPKVSVDGTYSGNKKASNSNIVPGAFVPNFYFVAPMSEYFTLGLGANVNYGLKTDLGKDYEVGTLGGMTSLKTVNFNLSGATKLGKGFSFGFGLNAVHAEAELERYSGDAESDILYLIEKDGKIKHLEGKKWGYGWNAGISYNLNENHRFGFAYHSAVDLDFNGKYSSKLIRPMGGTPNGAPVPSKLSVTLPSFWELSAYHQLTEKLGLQYSWKRTDWSVFTELKAVDPKTGVEHLHKQENFSDSNRYAIGLTYKAMDKLTIRTGIAYEEGASKELPSISIPDTNRTWYSVGATYQFTPNFAVDMGYAYVYGHKNNFVEKQKRPFSDLDVKSRAHVNLFGLNVNYKF